MLILINKSKFVRKYWHRCRILMEPRKSFRPNRLVDLSRAPVCILTFFCKKHFCFVFFRTFQGVSKTWNLVALPLLESYRIITHMLLSSNLENSWGDAAILSIHQDSVPDIFLSQKNPSHDFFATDNPRQDYTNNKNSVNQRITVSVDYDSCASKH